MMETGIVNEYFVYLLIMHNDSRTWGSQGILYEVNTKQGDRNQQVLMARAGLAVGDIGRSFQF